MNGEWNIWPAFLFFSLFWPIFVEAVVMSTSFGSFKGYLSVSKQTTVINAVSEDSFKWKNHNKRQCIQQPKHAAFLHKNQYKWCHFQFFSQMSFPPTPTQYTHTHFACAHIHVCVFMCIYVCMYAYVMGVCGQLANTLDDRSSQGFTPLAPRQENVFQFFSVNNWADSLAGAMETQTTSKSWKWWMWLLIMDETASYAFASRQKVHFTSFTWSLTTCLDSH